MKQCSMCKESKPLDSFYKGKSYKDGFFNYCIKCNKERSKTYRKLYPEKGYNQCKKYRQEHPEKQRQFDLKRKFNITIDKYNMLLIEQNNLCAICSKSETILDKKTNQPRALAVDHCHLTGKIRGLLCAKCNTALGLLSDDLNTIDKAKEYLIKNK